MTEKQEYIINNYGKISNKLIKESLNCSNSVIYDTLRKFKIPFRKSGSIINLGLDKIDKESEWFQYFIGWIASDGNIQYKKGDYRVSLSIKDESIVDLFLGLLPGAKKYTVEKSNGTMYILHIGNEAITKSFVDIGITPNKSNTLMMKNFKINNHFIRGVFDGDGNVRNISLSKKREAKITSGSIEFILQLQEELEKNNIKSSIYKNGKAFNLTTTSFAETEKFYIYMYNNCGEMYLKRKKSLFEAMFSNGH
jgi:hypothetical protein